MILNLFKNKDFDSLKYSCLFIGHPRSGHSLVGSIIDCHPNACISNEYNILLKYHQFWRRDNLFKDILRDSLEQAKEGRVAGGYDYRIPGLSQGNNSHLYVIGDKDGCKNTHHFLEDEKAFDKYSKYAGLPIRLIYVLRNPYDIVTTKGGYKDGNKVSLTREGIIESMRVVAEEAATNQLIINQNRYPIHTIYHEDLIANTADELKKMFAFLELEIDQHFIDSIQHYLYKEANKSRHRFEWDDDLKERMKASILANDVFSRYHFEN